MFDGYLGIDPEDEAIFQEEFASLSEAKAWLQARAKALSEAGYTITWASETHFTYPGAYMPSDILQHYWVEPADLSEEEEWVRPDKVSPMGEVVPDHWHYNEDFDPIDCPTLYTLDLEYQPTSDEHLTYALDYVELDGLPPMLLIRGYTRRIADADVQPFFLGYTTLICAADEVIRLHKQMLPHLLRLPTQAEFDS